MLTINTKEAKLEAKQYRLQIHHLLENHLDGKSTSFIRRDLCLNKDVLIPFKLEKLIVQYSRNREYHSQVLRVSKETLEDMSYGNGVSSLPLEKNTKYILKIYDPYCANQGTDGIENMPKKCMEHFATEYDTYCLIQKCENPINFVPDLICFGSIIIKSDSDKHHKDGGIYILMKNITGKTPDFTKRDNCQKVVSNLRILLSQNIVHGDIRKENLIESSDGTIYFIDFGFSSNKPQAIGKSNEEIEKQLKIGKARDFEKLNNLFCDDY